MEEEITELKRRVVFLSGESVAATAALYEDDVTRVVKDLTLRLERATSAYTDLEEELNVLKTQRTILHGELERARLAFSFFFFLCIFISFF